MFLVSRLYPPRLSSHSNGNALHASSIFSIYSVTLPSPLRVLADVAVPTIDELANEFIRLNLSKWASQCKVTVLLVWSCREMKRIVQNSTIFVNIWRLCNCVLFLCVVLICEVKPVYCECDLVTWILPFISFNPTTKKCPWSSSCVWGKSRRLRE